MNEEPNRPEMTGGLSPLALEAAPEVMSDLKLRGYSCLKSPLSIEAHETLAGRIGTVISRTDVKIDRHREKAQELTRRVKGRPGRYNADPLGFHTDNVRVDVMSMYCVEQDAVDGAILLLDLADVAEHFSSRELDALSRVELWAPDLERTGHQESFSEVAPLLSEKNGIYNVYYIPWLLRDSYDIDCNRALRRFADYVKHKEETQMIRLPIRRCESLFIDNHRMLHGRRAIAEDSKRHMVRLYVKAMS